MRAACWLAFLAPLFFFTYGTANELAAAREHVPSIVFGWERHIPFLAWSIIPYWSMDPLYALSLFVCRSRLELDMHARRLVTAQLIAFICFAVFPLRFAWPKPASTAFAGFLFEILAGFDKPFNQAPSLHIALLVLLWVRFTHHARRIWTSLLHCWFALIAVSVLTTWQHHLIDVPTGALLGLLCQRQWLAAYYATGAAAAAAAALVCSGAGLWLLWSAVSLAMVALAYLLIGKTAFQKDEGGRMSIASLLLFAPYLTGVWINSRVWTRDSLEPTPIADGVVLGRFPDASDLAAGNYGAIVDLTAELPAPPTSVCWRTVPMLDLVAPEPGHLAEAAERIETARRQGTVFVCCALGYSRSAATVAAWLAGTGRAAEAKEAIAMLKRRRPRVVLGAVLRGRIAAAAALMEGRVL
jgi:protein-tyrosine phosphatase